MYCVYFPQLGFLISLPQQKDETIEEASMRELEGLTFKFASNLMTYWKSKEMEDLDYHFGDLHLAILDRQLEIVNDLQQAVIAKQDALFKASQSLAELDV
jgi:DNA mismatch repair protein MSH5